MVAEESEAAIVFSQDFPLTIEEKIDGSSIGITLHDDHFVVRNRDDFVRKGTVGKTAAKKQFAPLWNWIYDHEESLRKVLEAGEFSIYGEWCLARHGIAYERLPDWFIAYDIYDYKAGNFASPPNARKMLKAAGFTTPAILHQGMYEGDAESLLSLTERYSAWADEKAEGLYIKVYSEARNVLMERFKMVREDFQRGRYWSPEKITKNVKAA